MFWILRRTGAVNFFNSLNNNCSTSKGSNNGTNDKYVKRPPRKAYGRLSVDSDDAISMNYNKIDDPFDDLDQFDMIAPGNGGNGNKTATKTMQTTTHECHASGPTDCQGNYVEANVCDLNLNGRVCGETITASVCGGIAKSKSTNGCSSQKELNENTISRLHAMVMSDDEDYDESLTCNVCDRAFHCHRQLASHQQKKRHFGCSGCDSLFPSLMLLEHHKEEFEHWSDEEISRRICCRRNRGDDYFTDTDSFTSEAESEDLERLL